MQIFIGCVIPKVRRLPGAVTWIPEIREHSAPVVHTTSKAATSCGISVTDADGFTPAGTCLPNSASTSVELTRCVAMFPIRSPVASSSAIAGYPPNRQGTAPRFINASFTDRNTPLISPAISSADKTSGSQGPAFAASSAVARRISFGVPPGIRYGALGLGWSAASSGAIPAAPEPARCPARLPAQPAHTPIAQPVSTASNSALRMEEILRSPPWMPPKPSFVASRTSVRPGAPVRIDP